MQKQPLQQRKKKQKTSDLLPSHFHNKYLKKTKHFSFQKHPNFNLLLYRMVSYLYTLT